MPRNLVIFDGSNFYHKVKSLCPNKHLTNFNYIKLVTLITDSPTNIVEYCVGEIRKSPKNPISEILYKNQQALFYNLQTQGINVKRGFMLENKGKFHEKGVDVRIAVDLLKGALKNEYDNCFLITSDTDIIPAIEEARLVGKKVVYVGFSHAPNKAMSSNCSKTIAITKKMLERC